jgi:hypothetical protein
MAHDQILFNNLSESQHHSINMEAVDASEMSVNSYHIAWNYVSQDSIL